MFNNRKWAVIFIPSLIISAIQATPNLLPLVHNEHHNHHHPEVLPTPVTLDHEPHLAHPVPLSHGDDLHHNHEKLPLPLAHDPHKHDHHHYKDPYHPIPQYYHFGYQVNSVDGYGANDYHGHTEQADAYTKKGEYKVKLPDGRLQVISYIADEYGFKPRITYEYPEGHPPPHDHHADLKHAPHLAPHPPHPPHPVHAGHDIVPHHPVHPVPHPHVVPHEHLPVKKPYHPPAPPKSIYKHPVEKEYLPPKPVLKLEKIPHPTPTPVNYVTPDPTIILPLASYEEPHSPKKLIHHEIGHNDIDLSYLPPTGHSDLDLSYLPPTMHSTPSNLVYKALPLRTVHDSSSIGMVHKGSPYVLPKIKTYIPPEKAHDVSPDVYVTPKPAYVTPRPASYVTPLPKQVSQLHHKVPTVTPTPVVMYSTTPKMVNSLYTVPYHNSIERQDTSPTNQIDASLKQHYYLVSYQDPEDHKPKLFLLAKKN